MVGRPGRIKSKGSEASNSQDGDTPKSVRVGKRQGRPRKPQGLDDSLLESEFGSRESTPFSPANPPSLRRRTSRGDAQLINLISEFDTEEDFRSHRLARYLAEHPDSREELARLNEDRPSFPPYIEDKDLIEHDGYVYRTGDIVCLFDEDDEQEEDLPYYAQIRSLITDQFSRNFAWITWLVPKSAARDAHEFEPAHFVHSLIDQKIYGLECLRWECERPDLPAYQIYSEHRAVLDQHRLSQLRARRVELFKAAHFGAELTRSMDVVRGGDVRAAHSKEHADELAEVLERAQERDMERRAAREKAASEGTEEKHKEKDYKRFSSSLLSRSLRCASSDDDLTDDAEEAKEGEGGEKKRTGSQGRKRSRAASQASETSKATEESAESSVKPMEQD